MQNQIYTAFHSVWVKMVEHDPETAKHSLRTTVLCDRFAAYLGLDQAMTRELRLGAMLHDLGKLKIERSILTKPGKLTEDEYAHLQQHPIHGVRLLEGQAPYLTSAQPYIRSHHERLDGTGYPDKLNAPEIPLPVRVLTLCDSYDSMAYDRAYRPALTKREIVRELLSHEEQFDTQLVQEFLEFLSISSKLLLE